MGQNKNSFRHESLQQCDTIQEILTAITRGFAKGKLEFSDDDGEITLRPEGLMNLKVSASQDETRHRVTIRVAWQPREKSKQNRPIRINPEDDD